MLRLLLLLAGFVNVQRSLTRIAYSRRDFERSKVLWLFEDNRLVGPPKDYRLDKPTIVAVRRSSNLGRILLEAMIAPV